jgi:hypothetical protein
MFLKDRLTEIRGHSVRQNTTLEPNYDRKLGRNSPTQRVQSALPYSKSTLGETLEDKCASAFFQRQAPEYICVQITAGTHSVNFGRHWCTIGTSKRHDGSQFL